MSAVVAFNTLLVQFMKELADTFPSDMKMKIYKAIVEGLCQGEATVGVDTFRETLIPHKAEILAKDEAFFDVVEPLFGQVDLGAIWKSGLSEDNREVVWEYLGALTTMCEHATPVDAGASAGAGALSIPSEIGGMTIPPEIGAAISQMMQGVDMKDVVALAKDIDEKDIQDIVTSIDPMAMSALMTDFSMDKLMDMAKGIDPSQIAKIADKFDKEKLAKVASKVDQQSMMAMLGGALPAAKKRSRK